jgi:hypothetical protein
MLMNLNGDPVDVLDPLCPLRECFRLGEDRGAFTRGRGYTSRRKPRLVCLHRHLNGCPDPLPEPSAGEKGSES